MRPTLIGIALLGFAVPVQSEPFEAAKVFRINDWQVSCRSLGTDRAGCHAQHVTEKPFVDLTVQVDKVTLQIRAKCSFNGLAQPIDFDRRGKWDRRNYDDLTQRLNKAVEACSLGEADAGFASETIELLDLLMSATRKI
jgi:hypothetical protein